MKRGKAVMAKGSVGDVADPRSAGHDSQAPWPSGGTPVTPSVHPPAFCRLPKSYRRRSCAASDPEKIILFGRHVYGAPSRDSDVDLLVTMQTAARPLAPTAAHGPLPRRE